MIEIIAKLFYIVLILAMLFIVIAGVALAIIGPSKDNKENKQ